MKSKTRNKTKEVKMGSNHSTKTHETQNTQIPDNFSIDDLVEIKKMCYAKGCFINSNGKKYCSKHTCSFPNCDEVKSDKIHCEKHLEYICKYMGYSSKSVRTECGKKLVKEGYNFCNKHTCSETNCNAPIKDLKAKYCNQHYKIYVGRYCLYRGGRYPCGNRVKSDNPNKYFCKNHECSLDECYERFQSIVMGKQLCDDHASQMIEKIQKAKNKMHEI